MNILFLSELFYPNGGGAELATYLYAKLLSESGFNIVVVTNKFVGESEVSKNGNMTVYRLPSLVKAKSVKYSVLNRIDVLISSLIKKMMKWADLVYISRFWYSAILLAKAYGKPVITHLHDYTPVCPLANLYESPRGTVCCNLNRLHCPPKCIYTYERNEARSFAGSLTSVLLNTTIGRSLGKLVALSDAIICVSSAHKELIATRAPDLCQKIHVIYNPLPKLSYTKIEGDDFGYFGGPHCLKGFHVLYNALVHTKDKRIRVHATNFSDATRVLSGLSNRQFLLYKRLDNLLFEKIWKQIRALIVPSIWHEPLPYVVSEAILRGRIVIASNVGGIPEQVEGCKGNLLCEIGNYHQLAEALDFARGSTREDVVEWGFQNRETFLKRFDNETIIREFVSLCEHLN